TNPYYVNIRSGASIRDAIIGQADPGAVYPCISTAASGWYLILLDDGRSGYVSANITTFTPGNDGYQPITPPNQYQVQVPIYYRDAMGNMLYTDYINLYTGSRLIEPNKNLLPGYRLLGPNNVVVSVSSSLVAMPSSVTFLFSSQQNVTPPPAPTAVPATPTPVPQDRPAYVPVQYIGPQGEVFYSTSLTLWRGTNYIQPQYSAVPAGYVLSSSSSVAVSVNAYGQATPSVVVFVFRQRDPVQTPAPTAVPTPRPQPTQRPVPPATEAGYLPDFVKTKPIKGSYPVYTGPGEGYYRVGNATLGGGTIRVYGQENGWVLIGYGLSNGGYRIGFVSMSAIAQDINPEPLQLTYTAKNNVSASLFVDDPIVSKNRELSKRYEGGSPFYFLAYLNDFWAYVEIENFEGTGQPARGFVSRRSLGV
ncbi:MAG: hypothetical protein GX781_08105, partial [Clostridiales bacterium]|nr:hypothetical protein [Clostridiales bacterium]